MSSGIFVYIHFEPYLAQWLIHEQGGEPIRFQRNSTESNLLEVGLTALPDNALPEARGTNTVAVELPFFKNKDVRVYNHLPKSAKNAIKRCVRNRFIIDLWEALNRFGYIGEQKQDIVYAWMQANGIEPTETNFNSIIKIYQRRRKSYLQQKYRKNLPDFGHKKRPSVD